MDSPPSYEESVNDIVLITSQPKGSSMDSPPPTYDESMGRVNTNSTITTNDSTTGESRDVLELCDMLRAMCTLFGCCIYCIIQCASQ